ncbi:MAG: hypothetical protein V1744_06345 [Candidatus Altiarchaeota archaeon]
MGKMEILLVGVLVVLALLIGMLFGGSSIWFLKPTGEGGVTEKVVNKYVCSDGSVKDNQNKCPKTVTGADGKMEVVCPPCKTSDTTSPLRKCDCVQCESQCGVAYTPTTTTLYIPPCTVCTSNAECGQPSYSEIRCKNDDTYKMYLEPYCADEDGKKCCKTTETVKDLTPCPQDQRCVKGQGCEIREQAPEEETA